VALALGRGGRRLALIGRRARPLAETLESAGTAGLALPLDVRDAAAVGSAARRIETELGPVDGVIPAAGLARIARFEALEAAAFEEVVAVNLLGAANLFRAFLPGLRSRGRGALVPILSVAARTAFPEWSAYAASKWGLLGLVESLRLELAGSGVRVLAITPGATDSPLWDELPGAWDRRKMIPAEEVARAVTWALEAGEEVAVEEIRLRPPGGDL
ncbi:MAG TPA: SDR family oxidoreductase, partial [Thermoanaerobaculia bacterium]|nr:SDR family oxidoreductase [Thermoanaerobaculia bacterium]